MADRRKPAWRRGQLIRVPFAVGDHPALVTDVRLGLIFVTVDPDSDHPTETFYHEEELAGR